MDNLNCLVGAQDASPYSTDKSLVSYSDSLISNLKRNQLRLKSQLDSVTEALNALEKNPEMANVLELISKAGH